MCGVAGFFFPDGQPRKTSWWQPRLSHALQSLKHRGPDDQGFWLHPQGYMAMIHTRLSIIDPDPRSRQPMSSQSGRSILTYNGEIYNYRELKTRISEVSFQTTSDTEVLLEGLEADPTRFFNAVSGMFALGLFSLKDNSLLLARDPVGKKPLYTYWDGEIFAFASEIKAFQAFGLTRLDIDQQALKQYLIFGYVPAPGSAFQKIRRLAPGHYQRIELKYGPLKPEKYWQVPVGKTKLNISLTDACAGLRDHIQNAVQQRLVADVPVGSFLSGGLDSSIVSLEASRLVDPGSLQTFSLGYTQDALASLYDESAYARTAAQRIGSIHHEIQLKVEECQATQIMRHFDEPFADSSSIPSYILCKETARHVKVALSGDGADELFGGYLRLRAGVLAEQIPAWVKMLISHLPLNGHHPRSFLGYLERFKDLMNQSLSQRLLLWNCFFQAEDFKKWTGEQTNHALERWNKEAALCKDLSPQDQMLYLNFLFYLEGDLMAKVDRTSMAHGLEVRSPFLDCNLIEFAFSLPSHYKFNAFRTKHILKAAYEQDLGRDLVYRKKKGFGYPIESDRALAQWRPESKLWEQAFMGSPRELPDLDQIQNRHKHFMLWTLEQSLAPALQLADIRTKDDHDSGPLQHLHR